MIEVGSHIFTAGEVTALPVVIGTGANQGTFTPNAGMGRTAQVDRKRGCVAVCWMERAGALICGTYLSICTLNIAGGREWLTVLSSGICGNGNLVRLERPTSVDYGLAFLISQSCVAAGDELRWRVLYDAA